MDFNASAVDLASLADIAADALVFVLPAGGDAAPDLGGPLGRHLQDALALGGLQLKAGRTLCLYQPEGVAARRLVWSVAADTGPKAFRAAVHAGISALKGQPVEHLAVASAVSLPLGAAHAEALVAAAGDATYVYRHTRPGAEPAWALARVTLLQQDADAAAGARGLARGRAIAAGVELARDCTNRPGNHCRPTQFAQQAEAVAAAHGLAVEVMGRRDVEKLGMGAFLAVAQGSEEPLRFIVLRYQGAPRRQAPVVLVGKGITFDTGGISLKPAAEMDEMKSDMGGAASVLGTLRAIAELKPRINVIGVMPCCENMPDGRAVKPGDVVTSLSGQTIEILNTDAEGRLILCDALAYVERFKPAAVIDIATLTGACVVALGHHRSGLFCRDDTLADQLLRSGEAALDPCWRLPLDEEYGEALKSEFADVANVGAGPAGGAIRAAAFLSRFTAGYRWAHLDVAGTAWRRGESKGATGRPVPLLTHYLLGQAEASASSTARPAR
ncbi:leucyl aminopeptidase [Aquabacterium sp. A7-Y]|uniref:leucyl aminopeptidase n=1 Tax=Aquabacterium sp. A7-Y TaxID=1349605 RepID=UPI0039FDD5D9